MNTNELTKTMFVRIGNAKTLFQVSSFAEASKKWTTKRDATGMGVSRMPKIQIVTESGNPMFWVAYNGKIVTLDWNTTVYSPF